MLLTLYLQSTRLLNFLIVESHVELRAAIVVLDPLPNRQPYLRARQLQHKYKYADGPFSLRQVTCRPVAICHDL